MPNYCNNVIEAKSADVEKLKAFRDFIGDFSLNKVIPMPDDIRELNDDLARQLRDPRAYNWKLENWGTNWEMINDFKIVDESETGICISFSTAWNPVAPVFKELQALFPDMELELFYFCLPSDNPEYEPYYGYINKNGKQTHHIIQMPVTEEEISND